MDCAHLSMHRLSERFNKCHTHTHTHTHARTHTHTCGRCSDVKMEDSESGKQADPLIFEGLAKLDIKGIIDKGQTLVSSTGTEYDDITDSIADPKERLAAKKQQLRAALGLDTAEAQVVLEVVASRRLPARVGG
jgi:hypothetical protein